MKLARREVPALQHSHTGVHAAQRGDFRRHHVSHMGCLLAASTRSYYAGTLIVSNCGCSCSSGIGRALFFQRLDVAVDGVASHGYRFLKGFALRYAAG